MNAIVSGRVNPANRRHGPVAGRLRCRSSDNHVRCGVFAVAPSGPDPIWWARPRPLSNVYGRFGVAPRHQHECRGRDRDQYSPAATATQADLCRMSGTPPSDHFDRATDAAMGGVPVHSGRQNKGKESIHSLPHLMYSTRGGLRQGPGGGAESSIEARTCGNLLMGVS